MVLLAVSCLKRSVFAHTKRSVFLCHSARLILRLVGGLEPGLLQSGQCGKLKILKGAIDHLHPTWSKTWKRAEAKLSH